MKSGYKHFRAVGRRLAMQFLFQYDLTGEEFQEEALSLFFERLNLPEKPAERRTYRKGINYGKKLIQGIIEHFSEIDAEIISFIAEGWSWKRIAPVDRAILRVAAYEMLFTENVPPVVAINEAVEIIKEYGASESRGFVNALLNSIKNHIDRDPRISDPSLKPQKKLQEIEKQI
jgi:N utilization substance protein B